MSDQDPSPASHPAADLQTERRAYVRLASDLTASCDAADRVHEAGWAGRVRTIEALVVHAAAILVDGNPCRLLGCASTTR